MLRAMLAKHTLFSWRASSSISSVFKGRNYSAISTSLNHGYFVSRLLKLLGRTNLIEALFFGTSVIQATILMFY
jgi:hypothetical protein